MKLKVLKELGRGGFGIVELVEDENGDRFARKRFSVNQPMPDELIPNVRKRFVREADLQSGIAHRHIVPILHKSLSGDDPWYLMPVAVKSLADEIEIDRRLNGDFKRALSDIISGLEELHEMEMFHRDLKPQNVLKFVDDETLEVFYSISDFGFVSLKDSKLSKLTYTGMKKGADYFTAPEMTKDLRKASAQADIYSLGCIIHEMVGEEERVPCAEIRESTEYGAVLINCTRSNPARRFKDVSSVREVLFSIEDGTAPASTQEGASIVEILEEDAEISSVDLARIVEFVEDNQGQPDAAIVLRKLTTDRIEQAWELESNLAKRLGFVFSEWVGTGDFGFEFCDVLGNRALAFIKAGSVDLQAECLMALLALGTSHNRWYVEGLFRDACSPSMNEVLAKRLAVELRARGEEACEMIDHLEQSISADRNSFHPLLIAVLNEVCS